MSLSENIRAFRLKKNLTQEQLAELLGVSAQAVSKWETTQTYPDPSLLLSLSEALEVSLDRLFDRRTPSVEDASYEVFWLIRHARSSESYRLMREIGWQMERGLFKSRPKEWSFQSVEKAASSSYGADDYGFTMISNGDGPFFSVFPEPEAAYGPAIGDGENIRELFACLSTPEAMRAALYLLSMQEGCVFEAAVLGADCGIAGEKLDKVMEQMERLHLVNKEKTMVDDRMRTLYIACPSHRLIALFLVAQEVNYDENNGYMLQMGYRSRPWLKEGNEG
ncbi:MAG: helix-turn-helix domain-containing protein [Lachnospiraceae bacterium]|nr:helix-turn-helix domain-containing protein [Lachnospiraceae bacterium]